MTFSTLLNGCLIHSVENWEFFCHSDFTWNQIERFEELKLPSFQFQMVWILFLAKFQPSEIAQNHQFLTSKPQKCQNDNFRNFWNSKNWFHVKSKWQKNSKTFTLYIRNVFFFQKVIFGSPDFQPYQGIDLTLMQTSLPGGFDLLSFSEWTCI